MAAGDAPREKVTEKASQKATDKTSDTPVSERPVLRAVDAGMSLAEDLLYGLLSIVLVVAAGAVLFQTAHGLATDLGDGVEEAIKSTLDRLLLVFILVELIGAVRATIKERKLVAEPFLVVGIIASIKEIVVIALDAKKDFGRAVFDDAMIAVGVLTGLLVGLGITIFLLRRKEREPEE